MRTYVKHVHVLSDRKVYCEDETTGWRLLANAIILQAIQDYTGGSMSRHAFVQFVTSDYFSVLSRGCIDPDRLLKEVLGDGRS